MWLSGLTHEGVCQAAMLDDPPHRKLSKSTITNMLNAKVAVRTCYLVHAARMRQHLTWTEHRSLASRKSGPDFLYSGILEFRKSDLPEFRMSKLPEFGSTGFPEIRIQTTPMVSAWNLRLSCKQTRLKRNRKRETEKSKGSMHEFDRLLQTDIS